MLENVLSLSWVDLREDICYLLELISACIILIMIDYFDCSCY